MKVTRLELEGVLLIEPQVFQDPRGFFLETYHAEKYGALGLPTFVQDNHSRSQRGTLRGLHAQRNHPQGKLVRAVEGSVFDVVVDIRRGSPTFGRWLSVTLSAESFRQVYVPPGFLHGFCVTSEAAQIEYKCTDFYDPTDELGVAWNDPRLAIRWPVAQPLLSRKDAAHPTLAAILEHLER